MGMMPLSLVPTFLVPLWTIVIFVVARTSEDTRRPVRVS